MPEIIICPGCRNEISNDISRCMICGHALDKTDGKKGGTPVYENMPPAPRRDVCEEAPKKSAFTAGGTGFSSVAAFTEPSAIYSQKIYDHYSLLGFIVIVIFAVIGMAVCGFIGFSFCMFLDKIIPQTFYYFLCSGGFRDIPIVFCCSFFLSSIVTGCYLGGSVGKNCYLSFTLDKYRCAELYSNYWERFVLSALYGFLGGLMNSIALTLIFFSGMGHIFEPMVFLGLITTVAFPAAGIYRARKKYIS